MFYAANADGTLAKSNSTANGYGHWFNASGKVSAYGSGYVYSEFNPSTLTFDLGQYPGRCSVGTTYTIRQALRYKKSATESATAMFVFNITIGATGTAASSSLTSIDYADPTTGISAPYAYAEPSASAVKVYTLTGQFVKTASSVSSATVGLPRGIYIVDGRKVMVK